MPTWLATIASTIIGKSLSMRCELLGVHEWARSVSEASGAALRGEGPLPLAPHLVQRHRTERCYALARSSTRTGGTATANARRPGDGD